MKASHWLKGRRAIKTVPLPLAKQADRSGSIGGVGSPPTDAEAPVVGLRALGPIEHEGIMQRAHADARAAGLEKPTEEDEAYRYYKALHLVVVACVDPDSPEEPFFDGGLQQLRDSAELGRDGIAWLAEHFTIEPADAKIIEDPNRYIIRRNGAIFFALAGDEVVGCCALRRHAGDVLELAEMAVTAEFRRRGIGRRLAESTIARAREWGADRLWLQTSPVLVEAIALYHSLGFRRVEESPFPADRYRRPTFSMVLELVP